jgi:hypothetical protein
MSIHSIFEKIPPELIHLNTLLQKNINGASPLGKPSSLVKIPPKTWVKMSKENFDIHTIINYLMESPCDMQVIQNLKKAIEIKGILQKNNQKLQYALQSIESPKH